jgi:small subunit ribosomal protein S9
MGVIHKIGRRKTAVARVYVSEGTGVITVNKKIRTYFQQQLYSTKYYNQCL